MKDNEILQGSEVWKSIRRDKLGGSDCPAVLGVSKYTTPFGLWQQKMGLVEQSYHGGMKRGHDLEEEARCCFKIEHGIEMKPAVMFHPEHDWMMCSLDGLSSDGQFSVEIKCLKREDHEAAKDGIIHEMYLAQMQHQMAVTGHKQMFYFSYYPYEPSYTIIVKKDDEYIEKMLEEEKEFYRRMIEFDPPPLCEKDYKDLSSDSDFNEWALIYLEAHEARKRAQEREDVARESMISIAQGNAKNQHVRITSYARKGNIEYAKIPELSGIDLEKYRKPVIQSFRISEVNNGNTVETFP